MKDKKEKTCYRFRRVSGEENIYVCITDDGETNIYRKINEEI